MNYFGYGRPARIFLGEPDHFSRRHDVLGKIRPEMSAADFKARILQFYARLPHVIQGQMLNHINTHDLTRIYNDPAVNRDEFFSMVILMFTLPGMPSIYYGDERLLDGRHTDLEGARFPMDWSPIETADEVTRKNFERYRLLAHLKMCIRDSPETYQGGDFQGIIDNLDYLDALGINMVWITPIVDNIEHDRRHGMEGSQYGYHGYWAKDFETIDEHWGDLETFHDLIDEAAEKDIRLMIDVVLNHAGYGMKASDDGNGIDHFPSHEDRQRFVGMLREDPAPHTVTGELMGLPDFITEDPGVRKALVGWQSAWIEKSMTVAGNRIAAFRVDTVKHADATLWRALKKTTTCLLYTSRCV